jgi:hypothetical protein
MTYLQNIKKIFIIYFTSFPYNHYNCSKQYGNLELILLSCELIYVQQTFWLANFGFLIFIYNMENRIYIYYNLYLFVWSIFLYLISFIKLYNIL